MKPVMIWMVVLILSLVGVLARAGATDPATDAATVELSFEILPQGNLGEVRVTGTDIERVRVAFLDHQYILVPQPEAPQTFWGLVVAPLDADAGQYRLSVLVSYADGEEEYIPMDVRVSWGEFASVDFNLPADLSALIDPDIALDEYALLDAIISELHEDETAWASQGLEIPFYTPVSAVFGTYRRFNGEVWQRHTGIDFPRTIGTLIPVSASGRVVFNGRLDIRGNYVLVDHGAGLFTGYAHLSEVYVNMGDVVQQGDFIGEVGNTGRSLGPHLHWEVALGGAWVDPFEIVAYLPSSAE